MVKCQNVGMKATWVMTDEEKQEKKEAALAKKRLKEISGNFGVSNLFFKWLDCSEWSILYCFNTL